MNKQEKKALETKLWWAIQNTENKLFALRLQLSELSGEPDEILDAPEAPPLTDEQVEILEHLLLYNTGNSGDSSVYDNKPTMQSLHGAGHIAMGYKDNFDLQVWTVTDTGRAALRAHKGRNAS